MAAGNSHVQRVRGSIILALLATGLLFGVTGYWRMFAHFPGYDDEGYILLTVREYLQRGDLYGTVYSQYGPAFYVVFDAWHGLTGIAVDHAFARWFSLVCWMGCAAGAGVLVWRAGSGRAAAWFAATAVFLFNYQISEEAFHPGALVILVLPWALVVLLELVARGRGRMAAVAMGAAIAGLTLLKINVGVLFALGLGFGVLLSSGSGRWRWIGALGVLAGATGLMHGLIGAVWVQVFLLLVAVGAFGLATVARAHVRWEGRQVLVGLAGAAMLTGLVLAVIRARGTSFSALVEGILLGPLRHAGAYSFAVDWRPGTVASALVSLGALAWFHGPGREKNPVRAAAWLAGLRVVHFVGLLGVAFRLDHARVIGVLFSYFLPWLWLWVARLPVVADKRPGPAREMIAAVLLLQALHAYPVGGIQLCWGAFLVFPLAALALPGTAAWLAARPSGRWFGPALPVALTLGVVAKAGWFAAEFRRDYGRGHPLALAGTGALRLSPREVVTYRALVTNAALHADRLFSLPGMFSFNLWSEVPPPTPRNTTLWYSLLNAGEQRDIQDALARAERPALIVDGALVAIAQASGTGAHGELHDHLMAAYRPAFALRGLGFWIERDRTIAPVGTARAAQAPGAETFQVCLLGDGASIASIEITTPEEETPPLILDARNAALTVQFVTKEDRPRGPAQEVSWPFRFQGLARVGVRTSGFRWRPETCQILTFRDAAGTPVATAMFADP